MSPQEIERIIAKTGIVIGMLILLAYIVPFGVNTATYYIRQSSSPSYFTVTVNDYGRCVKTFYLTSGQSNYNITIVCT